MGLRGFDYECYRQARRANYRGTFRALLSSRTQNVDSIVGPDYRSRPVVNTNVRRTALISRAQTGLGVSLGDRQDWGHHLGTDRTGGITWGLTGLGVSPGDRQDWEHHLGTDRAGGVIWGQTGLGASSGDRQGWGYHLRTDKTGVTPGDRDGYADSFLVFTVKQSNH